MMECTRWDDGLHHIWFESPDLLHLSAEGVVQPNEAAEALRIITEEVAPNLGEFFLILHLYPDSGLSSGARKAFTDREPSWSGAAVVGGTSMTRALFNITLRAMSLLSSTRQPPTRLFATIEDVNAFINDLRSCRQAQAANT